MTVSSQQLGGLQITLLGALCDPGHASLFGLPLTGAHIAMAEHLDEIIGHSIEVEEHPDYLKNEKGERDTSIINDKALMHRFYGAVVVDGVPYRVMTLMREEKNPIVGNGIHAYEVQKIEVLDETPNTPNGTDGLNSELEASSAVANYFGK